MEPATKLVMHTTVCHTLQREHNHMEYLFGRVRIRVHELCVFVK